MQQNMKLGVCYYPEHWPENVWVDDARRMAEMGLSRVRIGEFAWSSIEPSEGKFTLDWMDRAIAAAQLQIDNLQHRFEQLYRIDHASQRDRMEMLALAGQIETLKQSLLESRSGSSAFARDLLCGDYCAHDGFYFRNC